MQLYPRIIVSNFHKNTSNHMDTVTLFFKNLNQRSITLDDLDPTSTKVTCVTLPKNHCVQVSWGYINVCGWSDQFCKIDHKHTYTHTYYMHTYTPTYRMSDHTVSFLTTKFKQDKNESQKQLEFTIILSNLFCCLMLAKHAY